MYKRERLTQRATQVIATLASLISTTKSQGFYVEFFLDMYPPLGVEVQNIKRNEYQALFTDHSFNCIVPFDIKLSS